MLQKIKATEVRNSFADIINRVMYGGEEFIVERQGKPSVLITQVKKNRKDDEKKITGTEFLRRISKYDLKDAPSDLAENHDKYTWD